MCQLGGGREVEEEKDSANLQAAKIVSPSPIGPSLQFVTVGHGGRVSNLRTVRSHVSREYHQKKKETKQANIEKLEHQRKASLHPSKAIKSDGNSCGRRLAPVEGEAKDGRKRKGEALALTSLSTASPPTTSMALQYRANSYIPYHWFEKDGPVLYVNRSTWPFSKPLMVTGSDRNDFSVKSLTPRQSHWMPYARSADFMSVKGAVLEADVVRWLGQTPECFQFRVETIKWIQRRLEDEVEALSDATVGAIMTLTMWTAGCGTPEELTTHMDAIERIVNLKGGFSSFQTPGSIMTARLTLFDSIIAVLTNQPPRFPHVTYILPHPITIKTHRSNTSFSSPLFGDGNFSDIVHTYLENAECINDLLTKMWILTQKFVARQTSSTPTTAEREKPIPFTIDPPPPNRIPLTTLPLLAPTDPTVTGPHIFSTLVHAAALYKRSLTSPYPQFSDPCNEPIATDLLVSFSACTADDFWIHNEGVLLWVLLVGTASSKGKNEAAFWMLYLSRTGNFGSAESWGTRCGAVGRFLDVQQVIRDVSSSKRK